MVWAVYSSELPFQKLIASTDIAELLSQVDQYSGEYHDYLITLVVVRMLQAHQFDKAQPYLTRIKAGKLLVDPAVVVYTLEPSEAFKDIPGVTTKLVAVYKGIRETMNATSTTLDSEFLLGYLRTVYKINPHDGSIRAHIYRLLDSDDAETVSGDHWGENKDLDQYLLTVLGEKQLHMCELAALDRLGQPREYCRVAATLLSDHPDLVDEIVARLPQVAEPDYSELVFTVVKANRSKGLQFLKKNTENHRAVNQRIMETLSAREEGLGDDQLQTLRIDYLEQALRDAVNANDDVVARAHDLAGLLAAHLKHQFLRTEVQMNYEILEQTYQIENDVLEPWPKMAWPDFVAVQAAQLEIHEYLVYYTKAWEVLWWLQRQDEAVESYTAGFAYFENALKGDMEHLLAFKDYYSAEALAVHQALPSPRKLHFFEPVSLKGTPNKESLLAVLKHYLGLEPQLHSVSHFVSAFGSAFDPTELLHELPSQIPLVYVADYCCKTVVESGAGTRATQTRKNLAKAEARHTKQVYRDLCQD